MTKIKSLLKWLVFDTLPFPWLALLLSIHFIALIQYPDSIVLVNKYMSNFLQFLGLIVVIKAVNDNVRIIDRGSLIKSFKDWLNAFPLRKRNITIQLNTAGVAITGGDVKLRVTRKTKTLEDRINYAFEEIERLEKEIENANEKFSTRINVVEGAMGELHKSHENKLRDIDTRLNDVFVGGAKEEVFGILCIFYSLITSFFS